MMLHEKVDEIIKQNGFDKCFCLDSKMMCFAEVREYFEKEIVNRITANGIELTYVIYPAGNLGKDVADIMLKQGVSVRCMIDNNPNISDYRGIPIYNYEEYLKHAEEETLLLCSINYSAELLCTLKLDRIEKVLDVGTWYRNIFSFMSGKSIREAVVDIESIFTFEHLNELERKILVDPKVHDLKMLLYGLMMIRDFSSAKIYAEKYSEYIGKEYDIVLHEIEEMIQKRIDALSISNVMVLHVIDSLKNQDIGKMAYLSNIAANGLRIEGLKTQYPYTLWALNTLFTGKSVFDIEMRGEKVHYEDSELLRFVKNKMLFSVASANPYIMDEFEMVNNNVRHYQSISLSRMLFEGLCLIEESPTDHLILLHSYGEIHPPFFSIWENVETYGQEFDFDGYIDKQNKAIKYSDRQIEWYYRFYKKKNLINVFMGDHGLNAGGAFNYSKGIKTDMPRCSKEDISAAFVADVPVEKYVVGQISSTRGPEILMDILNKKYENIDTYSSDHTYIQQVPAYEKNFARKFIARGIYSQYEGFIGVDLDEDMYLKSATGREQYFRPNEFGYRNLIDNEKYAERIKYCKTLMQYDEYPYEIYAQEKYADHMLYLQSYDVNAYCYISKRIQNMKEMRGEEK